MTLNQLFWFWKILPFIRLFWEEQQKYLKSSQNEATYHAMNPHTDVTYQTVSLLSSHKCFIYLIYDVLDTWGAMICSSFGVTFLLFFMKIGNALHKSCQNSMLLFINGLTFLTSWTLKITSLLSLDEKQR